MCFGISLEVVERLVGKYLLHLVYRFYLAYVYMRECGEALHEEYVAPVDAREFLHHCGIGHLVVVALNVAQLHFALACLGYACLYAHSCVGLALGIGLGVACKIEHHLQIIGISGTYGFNLCVVREIVVAVAQAESALSNTNKVVGGILHVGTDTYSEHCATHSTHVELSRYYLIFATVLNAVDGLKDWLKRLGCLTVAAHAVHSEIVERTDFLSERALGLWL